MNKKLSSIVLALGLTASPVFAKQQNNRRANKALSGMEQKGNDKRKSNTLKRYLEIEAEKDFLKETEEEIMEVIGQPLEENLADIADNQEDITLGNEVILSESVPNGIDISAEFEALRKQSKDEAK